MGTSVLQFLNSVASPPHPSPLIHFPVQNCHRLSRYTSERCITRNDCAGASRWDSDAEKTTRTQRRFAFNADDDFISTNEEDEEYEEFGFNRRSAKQRAWWSNDFLGVDVDDNDKEEFEIFDGSIGISWLLKVLKAFGWMLPAIIISMLLGTGPNAFIMALALPLAQSALSRAMDALLGRSNVRPKPQTWAKSKPFAGATNNSRMRKEAARVQNVSVEKPSRRMPSFGGWDELDNQGRHDATPNQKVNEPRQQKRGKGIRRARKSGTPLLLRLLIAVFPFLGSWAKLL